MIKFYSPKDPYYEFSNFYTNKNKPIEIDGFSWSNVEHYFQAQKFSHHPEYYKIIQSCDSPQKIKNLGSQRKTQFSGNWVVNKKTDSRNINAIIDQYKHLKIHSDWDNRRVDIMKKALLAKFTQDLNLQKLLLSTKDTEIIEASPRDSYWGSGKNNDGLNKLGHLLMEVRSMIMKKQPYTKEKTHVYFVGFEKHVIDEIIIILPGIQKVNSIQDAAIVVVPNKNREFEENDDVQQAFSSHHEIKVYTLKKLKKYCSENY